MSTSSRVFTLLESMDAAKSRDFLKIDFVGVLYFLLLREGVES